MQDYLLNAWYMAGWEEEIAGDRFLARTIIDRNLMFYRKQDGSGYVALDDRCPHRFAPLHLGRRDGDRVVCGYHGLTFDAAGSCVHNPFSDKIPAGARVGTYPVVAKDSILWFWPGDPEQADPARIADFSCMASGPPQGRGHLKMAANYELLTDNLMDLSHIEFVHTGTFGGGGVIFKGEHAVKEDGDAIWSNWWMPDIAPPPWATFLPPDTRLDHWLDMRWQAPASMMLEIGISPAGAGRAAAFMPPMQGPHIITPETRTSSHYFYSFGARDGEDSVGKAFNDEDKPMIEAVQRSMGDTAFWERKPILLHVDAGAVRVRRRLAQMKEAEGE